MKISPLSPMQKGQNKYAQCLINYDPTDIHGSIRFRRAVTAHSRSKCDHSIDLTLFWGPYSNSVRSRSLSTGLQIILTLSDCYLWHLTQHTKGTYAGEKRGLSLESFKSRVPLTISPTTKLSPSLASQALFHRYLSKMIFSTVVAVSILAFIPSSLALAIDARNNGHAFACPQEDTYKHGLTASHVHDKSLSCTYAGGSSDVCIYDIVS